MSETKKLKRAKLFSYAVVHSPALKDLPAFAKKYLDHDITHINWKDLCVFVAERHIEKDTGLNASYRAKAYYFLFRKGLIVGTWDEPIRGGTTPGRTYCLKVPTGGVPFAGEINQEIKEICGSVSRPKEPRKLYKKAWTHFTQSVDAFTGKRGHICTKAWTHLHESVDAFVPKSNTTGLTDLTVKQVLTEKEQKKDLYYLKTLKDKRANEVMPDSDIKPFVCAVSQFEDFGQPQHAQVAELIEKNITARTLHRSAVAFRRVQKRKNPKGPYNETDFNALVETINIEHAKVAKPLN